MTSKRGFASFYNYSNAANPRVYLTVNQGDTKLGDLVFELYEDKQPGHTENFKALLDGSAAGGKTYVGKTFNKGTQGLGITGGKICDENNGAFGVHNPDGDLNLRHFKRGLISYTNEGPNKNGGEFTVFFSEAHFLDGYQTVFGELVEGDAVLAAMEAKVDRLGKVNDQFSIVAGGHKN